MPPPRVSLLLALLLAPTFAGAQPQPAVWRFVSPNATALIGIDWARIKPSQAGAMLREKWLNRAAMPSIPGLELLNDIDRVLISSSGNNPSAESGEQPVLIAIRGHFDSVRVRKLFTGFGAAPQSYDSFQIYRPQDEKGKDMAWVLFDPQTILFGDAPSVFAALDRSQFASPPAQPSAMIARATELDAKYEVWAIISVNEVMSNDRVASLFQGQDSLFQAKDWLSEAQAFDLGLNVGAGLTADITVRFSSDATAKRVAAELGHVINSMAKDKATAAQMQDLARKLKFTSDGPATRISLRLTPRELQKSAQAFAVAPQAPPPLAKSVEPAELPNRPGVIPGVIRIDGLDDGPREIPYPAQRH